MSQKIPFYYAIPVIFFSTLLVIAITLAWQEATSTPPLGNIAVPINIGSDSQIKSGPLQVNGFRNNGITVFDDVVGVGTTTPQSALQVVDGKYAQFEDNNAGAPPSADCDSNTERGRFSIDITNNRLYICNGATRGWDYLSLTD